jgi:hypothetical protein
LNRARADEYIPTDEVQINDLTFNTTMGKIILSIFEIAGDGPRDPDWYHEGDAFIVFYSMTNKKSVSEAILWERDVRSFLPDVPYLYCANKVDVKNPTKSLSLVVAPKGIHQYHLTDKSIHCDKNPFLHLMRVLTCCKDLFYV